ncbi:hypothetical protein L7F22_065955 [Adiantum nelumboides]|nr:hypothetical protein [Adiantum nelumboides]
MASVILESGSESEDQEESACEIECKLIVDEISKVDVEKQEGEEFVDSLSDDLPSLDDDLPMLEADDKRSRFLVNFWLEIAELFRLLVSSVTGSELVTSSVQILVQDYCSNFGSGLLVTGPGLVRKDLVQDLLVLQLVWLAVQILVQDYWLLVQDWLAEILVQDYWLLVQFRFWSFVTGSGPSDGTQGSATQDPHIAASESSSDFDVMEGYPMQEHPESSSQDMHALGQQPGIRVAEVQEVERYILAAREKEIESLRKAEQRRATLAKAPMTSANPLQSPELTTLKSQPIGSHIASNSKDTPNAAILDGIFLNENWEYNLQTEKLTDLYTNYTYHVGWLDVIQATSNSTSVDEQQRMICDVIHSIVQMERQNLGINMLSMGPMRFLDTTKDKQPTISQMETPSVSPMDPSYIVSPGVSMESEPTQGSFSFSDLVQPSLGDLPTPTMNMIGGAPSTLLASTTPLHTSVAPLPIPIGVHQPYVPVATHPYVTTMPPPNPIAYVPQSHYPSSYFSGAMPAGINTSYPTSAIPEPTSTSFRPSLGAVPYEVWDPRRVCMPRPKPANPFPYVVPRVPTPVVSTPIVPTHLGDLAAFAQTIDRSIVENMHNLPDRERRSKAVQVAKIAQKYNGDGDVRKHVEIFEQVCDSLGEYNDLRQHNLLQKTKVVDNEKAFIKAKGHKYKYSDLTYNEKAFIKTKGHKYKYSDLTYNETELPLRLISQHIRVQKPPRYTKPILYIAVVMALTVAKNRVIRCDYEGFILESLIEANLKGSAKNKLYMSAGPMLTRLAYQALGMIEDLPTASSHTSLIQNARVIARPVRTTTTATTSSRATRSTKPKSSSNSSDMRKRTQTKKKVRKGHKRRSHLNSKRVMMKKNQPP